MHRYGLPHGNLDLQYCGDPSMIRHWLRQQMGADKWVDITAETEILFCDGQTKWSVWTHSARGWRQSRSWWCLTLRQPQLLWYLVSVPGEFQKPITTSFSPVKGACQFMGELWLLWTRSASEQGKPQIPRKRAHIQALIFHILLAWQILGMIKWQKKLLLPHPFAAFLLEMFPGLAQVCFFFFFVSKMWAAEHYLLRLCNVEDC